MYTTISCIKNINVISVFVRENKYCLLYFAYILPFPVLNKDDYLIA